MTDLKNLRELAEKACFDRDNSSSLEAFQEEANPETVLGLIARIEKLEAALEFYADPRTYEGGHNDDVGSAGIDIDYRGNTAREALKEET